MPTKTPIGQATPSPAVPHRPDKKSSSALVYLRRTTCSRATRDAILARYPLAQTDPVLRRALVFLLFSAQTDNDTYRRLIGLPALRWIASEGIWHSSTRKGAFRSGESVLRKVRDELLPDFRWSGWMKGEKARQVISDGIDPNIHNLVTADLRAVAADIKDRVRVLDGSRYDRHAMREERARDRAEAAARQDDAPSATCRYFLTRMNDEDSRPSNGFTKVLKHMATAKALARTLPVEPRDPTKKPARHPISDAQRRALAIAYRERVIRVIEDGPHMTYVPSGKGRTDRIFSNGPSLLTLPTEIRRHLSDAVGWVEVDLSNVHLAIAAKLWGCDRIHRFLAEGNTAWPEIMAGIGFHAAQGSTSYRRVKNAIKQIVYSVVYGMTLVALKGTTTKLLKRHLGAQASSLLLGHWIFDDLLKARGRVMQAAGATGVLHTPTGIEATVGGATGADIPSVLSTVSQAYEAAIMEPILRYEEEHHRDAAVSRRQVEFRVMLWQHDGCSLWFKDATASRKHLAGITQRVAAKAAEFDIPTRLEVK
jgi:hypothetical protein